MSRTKIVIVGGGYAGMYAAARVARLREQVDITLIEPNHFFVQRIRLHEAAAGSTLKTFAYSDLLRKRDIRWIQGAMTGYDFQSQSVTIESNHKTQNVKYDYLVYALGSEFRPPESVKTLPNLFSLNSLAESQSLFHHLKNRPSAKVLVLGAGLTGLELSSELASRFHQFQIDLIDQNDPFIHFHHRAREHLVQTLEKLNVNIVRSNVSTHENLDQYDAIVWCGGMKTRNHETRWPVNDYLQLPAHSNVFIAGDSALVKNIDNSIIRMGCVAAIPMGAYCGDSIVNLIKGKNIVPFRFAFPMRCISLGRNNGLIQLTKFNDNPKSKMLTGKVAAWVKELICKMTFEFLKLEFRTGWRVYQWIQPSEQDLTRFQNNVEKS